jgi:protein tyrosine phosphatase (PTP) superfamily phosphohydrolase (DUF442 family)
MAVSKKGRGRRALVIGAVLAVAIAVPGWALRGNFRTVVPDLVYRSGQLSSTALLSRIAEYHLHSVLNLRGANPGESWYDEERDLAARQGVRHYDLPTDSEYPPSPEELRELIQVLDRCERPLLIHCQSGIDRTGLVAAVCVLLADDGSPRQAQQQLGILYGHLPWRTNTARQQAFVGQYEQWLSQNGFAHSPARFRQWSLHIYEGFAGPEASGAGSR